MTITNIQQSYFSATGTTKKVTDRIVAGFSGHQMTQNFLTHPQEDPVALTADDLFIVGMPVYAGRIPALGAASLANIKGSGTPAIAVVVYGNRDYDDALLELTNILTANGFVVLGAAAFVAQHAIFPAVGQNRPDAADFQKIDDFTNQCAQVLADFTPGTTKTLQIKGNFPYKEPAAIPVRPSGSAQCDSCGACLNICPTNAIEAEHPRQTLKDRCISCGACVTVCPQHARAFGGPIYLVANRKFIKDCATRQEPECFF